MDGNNICRIEDLNKLLNGDLKSNFQSLFDGDSQSPFGKDCWRMHYKGADPKVFLAKFGIDYDKPTCRAAVAFDLMKLADGSVSNDSAFTWEERRFSSPMEYERQLLNRNYRINLVNLEPEWSIINYSNGT